MLARRLAARMRCNRAATIIQKSWRRFNAQRHYQETRRRIIRLQVRAPPVLQGVVLRGTAVHTADLEYAIL